MGLLVNGFYVAQIDAQGMIIPVTGVTLTVTDEGVGVVGTATASDVGYVETFDIDVGASIPDGPLAPLSPDPTLIFSLAGYPGILKRKPDSDPNEIVENCNVALIIEDLSTSREAVSQEVWVHNEDNPDLPDEYLGLAAVGATTLFNYIAKSPGLLTVHSNPVSVTGERSFLRYQDGPKTQVTVQSAFRQTAVIHGQDGIDGEPSFVPGPAGPQGIQGVTGYGPPGIQGEEGEPSFVPGPIGPQGIQGPTGFGPQGIQGEEGEQSFVPGPRGPQGLQGFTGYGPQGIQGEDGEQSFIPGPMGPQGIQGPTGFGPAGWQGEEGEPSFVPGPPGQSLFTAGSVIFAGPSGAYAQDNANLFYDDANNRLGVGNATPQTTLHIRSASGNQFYASVGTLAHGMTALAPTDAHFSLGAADSAWGGAYLQGFTLVGSGTPPIYLNGIFGAAPSAGVAAVNIGGKQKSGTASTALSSTDLILKIDATAKVVFEQSGNVGVGMASGPAARLHVISTTEQFRAGYDASNYFKATVGSTGGVTFDAVGSGALFTFSDAVVMRRKWRVDTQASTATITPEVDTYDLIERTAQAVALNIANHSTSTVSNGEQFRVRLLDNGGAQAITYGTNYVAKAGTPMPSTTVASKWMEQLWEYYSSISKFVLMSVTNE